ncbi:cryptochrome/photolyase family protein, partial [Parvimonas micra]|uniref:cryptochrome/photolyase family protein n=1 Tax=Parvimonas micra TaxID=33033 RepID=UPI002B463594
QRDLQAVAAAHGLPLEITEDTHFLCTLAEFTRHASARKHLRMEFFYREMRRDYRVLMNGAQPEGGRWNFDSENRSRFPKSEAPEIEPPQPFKPDAT